MKRAKPIAVGDVIVDARDVDTMISVVLTKGEQFATHSGMDPEATLRFMHALIQTIAFPMARNDSQQASMLAKLMLMVAECKIDEVLDNASKAGIEKPADASAFVN